MRVAVLAVEIEGDAAESVVRSMSVSQCDVVEDHGVSRRVARGYMVRLCVREQRGTSSVLVNSNGTRFGLECVDIEREPAFDRWKRW